MQKGTDLPIWQPSSFNIFNQLPFKIYQKLPHWYQSDPNPMFLNNISRQFQPIAWHSKYQTLFPHTLKYKALRAIVDEDYQLLIKIIKNKQFDINGIIDQKYKLNALHLASMKNKYGMIQLLLMYGANINKKDIFGNSPLMLAIDNNSLQSINSLIKNGCDRENKNIYGIKAVDRAKYKKRYPQTKRKFPKFKVQLDIEKKIKNKIFQQIGNYKIFTYHLNIYPFNNFKGQYKISLNDTLTINQMLNLNML